ncbi:MAG: CinA family protein [Casimicrobiaceae bacterium]
MNDAEIIELAGRVGSALRANGAVLATAESCTGGLIVGAITEIAGSSGWFDRAMVTYSDAAKVEMLGVAQDCLDAHGAVSEPTARAMALGALQRSRATIAVAVTGVAGPGGGSAAKPVGMVCFGWAIRNGSATTETQHFPGDRAVVRAMTVRHALLGILKRLDSNPAGR